MAREGAVCKYVGVCGGVGGTVSRMTKGCR